MAVTPGYKQTEVGLIPEDWRVSTLGETCAFENGDRGKNYPSAAAFAPNGVPFINAGHVTEGRIRLSELNYISKESFDLLGSGKVMPGDILFCLRGSLGKFGVVGPDFGEGAIASSLIIVRSRSASLDRGYLSCYFRSAYCAQMIDKWSGGAAQPNLGAQDLARFTIPLPPTKAEQEAIAEALSDADALVESLEELLAKKRQLKQGAMQELLTGKTRLPGFSVKWERKPLGEAAPLQRGFDLPNGKLKRGPYPVVYSNGVLNRHAAFQVKAPGVVTGRSGTIGTVSFVEQDFWPHNTSLWVTSFKGNDPKFIFYLYTRVGLGRFATGSGVPTLNRNDVHAFKVSIPTTKPEQTAIAAILSDMDAEIATLEAKLTKVRQLKQGMMQELLTGRIRLV